MPRKSTFGFIWDEGQVFLGMEDQVITSYSNDDMTISIMQDNSGNLVGLAYETELESGDIVFGKNGSRTETKF